MREAPRSTCCSDESMLGGPQRALVLDVGRASLLLALCMCLHCLCVLVHATSRLADALQGPAWLYLELKGQLCGWLARLFVRGTHLQTGCTRRQPCESPGLVGPPGTRQTLS